MPQTPTTPPAPAAAKPKPPMPPPELQEAAIATMNAAQLTEVLRSPSSPEFQKAKACQRAGELGAQEGIPALAALLADPRLSTYARYGLEPMPGPAADEALRTALGKLGGVLRLGVIHSIGKRRDSRALPALIKLAASPEADLAQAAISATGAIGGADAVKALQGIYARSNGQTKMAAADALLACAERYLAEGNRAEGLAIYAQLSPPGTPQPARHAALSGILRAERSTSRPR